MDRRSLKKAYSYEHRRRAFQIAAIVHIIAIIVLSFFLSSKAEVQEFEEEIQVDIYELPKLPAAKKEVIPLPKKEPPKPKEEIPIPKRQITLQKRVTVTQPKQSASIAKMPAAAAPAEVNMQSEAVNKIDNVDVPPVLDAPALSTDVKLPTSVESALSSIASDIGTTSTKSSGRREGTGVKSPGKGTGTGKGLNIKSTGTADGVGKIGGRLNIKGIGTANGGAKIGNGNSSFGDTIKNLAEDIIQSSGGAPVDVVFVVDASGSMQENINAVAEHLSEMVDAYKASEIDYQLGLTHFSVDGKRENRIRVFQLTQDFSKIQTTLYGIELGGDEHALDAINETVIQQRFRSTAIKHLIVVTDEPFTSLHGFSVDDAINLCRKNKVYVNVLGIDKPKHKYLAAVTGGTWYPIPVNLNRQ